MNIFDEQMIQEAMEQNKQKNKGFEQLTQTQKRAVREDKENRIFAISLITKGLIEIPDIIMKTGKMTETFPINKKYFWSRYEIIGWCVLWCVHTKVMVTPNGDFYCYSNLYWHKRKLNWVAEKLFDAYFILRTYPEREKYKPAYKMGIPLAEQDGCIIPNLYQSGRVEMAVKECFKQVLMLDVAANHK